MSTEQLEKWIAANEFNQLPGEKPFAVRSEDLRALFAGKVLVPVEPTELMELAAIIAADRRIPFINDSQKVRAIWNGMLTASQEPKQ